MKESARMSGNILNYKRLSSERITASRLERKRYSVRREQIQRARRQQLGRCGEDLRAERAPCLASAGRPAGRSVGRSGSLTRTVADPSVDYSGDLTWTWKQVLGIRFSILHTTLINAARLLASYRYIRRASARWTLARGRMRYLVIPCGIMRVVCSTGDGRSSVGRTVGKQI